MKQINLKLGLAIGCVALTVLAVPFLYAGLVRLYYLYWSGDNIEKLLFEDLGFSRSWSSFFGVVGSFVFALAWVPLAFWTYRIFAGRVSGRQIGLAFASWILVYGHVPLLHALLGTNKCFNQRTGDYMKWYVEGPAGEIILSDSRGYDPVTRVERRPVTPEICAAWFAQSTQTPPRRITAQISEVEFFNPTSGQPVVWYSNSAECGFNLFNSKGFDPSTGEQLRPVNHEVISHIMACQRTAAIKPASTTPSPVLSPSPDLSLPGPYRTADICGRPVYYRLGQNSIGSEFVGSWAGNWNNSDRLCGGLVVEAVHANGTADLIYVYGPGKSSSRVLWKQQRQIGHLSSNGMLSFRDDEGSDFVFNLEGTSTLGAVFNGRSGQLSGTFGKVGG